MASRTPGLPSADPLARAREALSSLRDRLVGDPRFRRAAAAFPLTRPLARARAEALFKLCAGFAHAQILDACARSGLFALLREGPLTAAEAAPRLNLPVEGAAGLLEAAAGLGLTERRGRAPSGKTRYGLGPLGAAAAGDPGVLALVEHHRALYADLADPLALLRGENRPSALQRYWAYARSDAPGGVNADEAAPYSALMAASQGFIAHEVLAAYGHRRLRRHERLLDVGGGEGAFLRTALEAAPGLRGAVFDLPAVAARARASLHAAGLSDRAEASGGDAFHDPLPQGHDLVTLVRVLHDHDDTAALELLRACRAAMPANATLLLAEPMAKGRGPDPAGAYFAFYLLAMGQGRPRKAAENAALLREAGFTAVKEHRTRTPLLVRVLSARSLRER